ncbi:uncharacterized protein LOC117791882 [Drosophila innubila]|uniref:uncharacterized protein LOC117791882 n=1 Tax=Drosophila innubila TaxID=198719 RepID=UPI00148D2845|nr:uncharacterized protein LOC117791882 [Drosophila innubila]
MRRSQAPSMRRAAKRGLPACEPEVPKKVCVPDEMQWGTTGGYKSLGPRRYGETENPLKDKRIFLVLWRPQSNKKHKTWKGNGTLEVTESRATLKDETNKVLDVLTCFKPEKFQENVIIEIGTKDVELQMELKTTEECIAQRKEEIENWYRKQEEANGMVFQEDNNDMRPQRPMNVLKKPKHSLELESRHDISNCINHGSGHPVKRKEYICMLTLAELQHLAMQLLADHCQGLGQLSVCESPDIVGIAQRICDHPVLLKHIESQPIVSEILLPHLPPWQEMGLYDSAKFEFVHLMLDNLVVDRGEKCAIVASSQMCLDIIRGYCQCWEVPYIRIEDNAQAEYFNTPNMEDTNPPMVALLMESKLPAIRLPGCKYMILYNYSARSAATQLLANDCDTQIYTLITAGCLEERLFQQHFGLVESSDSLMELVNLRVNSTHKLLGVGQNTLSSWSQLKPPFSEAVLKEAFLCDKLPSLKFVMSKQIEIIAGSEV